jgi:hypothetical protein
MTFIWNTFQCEVYVTKHKTIYDCIHCDVHNETGFASSVNMKTSEAHKTAHSTYQNTCTPFDSCIYCLHKAWNVEYLYSVRCWHIAVPECQDFLLKHATSRLQQWVTCLLIPWQSSPTSVYTSDEDYNKKKALLTSTVLWTAGSWAPELSEKFTNQSCRTIPWVARTVWTVILKQHVTQHQQQLFCMDSLSLHGWMLGQTLAATFPVCHTQLSPSLILNLD